MQWLNDSHAGSTADCQMFVYYGAHRHFYAVRDVRSNQHQRTEHWECVCGHRIRKIVRWAERTVRYEEAA